MHFLRNVSEEDYLRQKRLVFKKYFLHIVFQRGLPKEEEACIFKVHLLRNVSGEDYLRKKRLVCEKSTFFRNVSVEDYLRKKRLL